jgi:hypothetical protein
VAKTLLGFGLVWAHIFCKIDFSTHWKEIWNGKKKNVRVPSALLANFLEVENPSCLAHAG